MENIGQTRIHYLYNMVNVLKFCAVNISDKMAYANSTDPDQIKEQSDQGLHCLLFY